MKISILFGLLLLALPKHGHAASALSPTELSEALSEMKAELPPLPSMAETVCQSTCVQGGFRDTYVLANGVCVLKFHERDRGC